MVHQVIYALRGWIAFVAFIDLGTAIQCFLDADSFLGTQLYTDGDIAEHVNPAMSRLLGDSSYTQRPHHDSLCPLHSSQTNPEYGCLFLSADHRCQRYGDTLVPHCTHQLLHAVPSRYSSRDHRGFGHRPELPQESRDRSRGGDPPT
ncbi:hypothetical protein Pcinc_032340 [Petrolisthes cinctipes]|uniref:Uncharacterized protein n=1 Tax=Petrolisthes cinctipes TaxID=88211 RepID=A0AAE1EUM7_PETCI|nr:hypothetical protein Pcinc_032340 [Petrolisthes cinctipes]